MRPVEPVVPRPGRTHHRRRGRDVAHLRDAPAFVQLDPPRAQHSRAAVCRGVADVGGDQAVWLRLQAQQPGRDEPVGQPGRTGQLAGPVRPEVGQRGHVVARRHDLPVPFRDRDELGGDVTGEHGSRNPVRHQ